MPHGTAFVPRSFVPRGAETCPLESTSFIGRDRVLADLLDALDAERLTTLWGMAGVGKTRLLRRACAETTARGRVTVVEVMDLVPARDRAALVAAVAQALGVSLATVGDDAGVPLVGDALAHAGDMLLALDGLEHLVPHAEVIATWLARAPALRVLCTSRTRLALPGERALELEPLSPTSGVALFEDRVRAITGSALTAGEHTPAHRIVRAISCVPLAVELAAARAAVGGVAETADLLERAATDQDVMPMTVRWAYQLLSADEQDALARLACCADGAPLEVAQAVIGGPEAQALIQALRRHALAWTRHGRHGEQRVGVYSSVRDFLGANVAPSAQATSRHAQVVAAWAAPMTVRARSEDAAAMQALLDDGPNVDLALARADDDRTLASLALAAATVAHRRGSRDAHDAVLARGLAAAHSAGLLELERDLLERQAALRAAAGASSAALRSDEAAVAASERLGNVERTAAARARMGFERFWLGMREEGIGDLDKAIATAPASSAALALAHNRRGVALLSVGDLRGLDDLSLAASVAAHTGDRALRTGTLIDLARAYRRRGAVELAAQRLLEAGAHGAPPNDEQRALFLVEQAALARVGGRSADAGELEREARAAARTSGTRAIIVATNVEAAELALDREDVAGALAYADIACAEARQIEAPVATQEAQLVRARARRANRDLPGARAALAAVACALARFPHREHAGLLAIERALLEGEPDGSAPQMRRDLAAAAQALAPLGGRPAAIALAMRALLDPEQVERPALIKAAGEALDEECRALLALACGEPVDGPGFFLLRGAAPLRRSPVRREMVVGGDGRFYELDGRRISLARQRSLRLIFLALVDEAERRPGHGLGQPEVLARGWPGEKMRPDSGATRVYTSIRRLRRGGLEGVLVTRDDGYLIDPHIAVRRVVHA